MLLKMLIMGQVPLAQNAWLIFALSMGCTHSQKPQLNYKLITSVLKLRRVKRVTFNGALKTTQDSTNLMQILVHLAQYGLLWQQLQDLFSKPGQM